MLHLETNGNTGAFFLTNQSKITIESENIHKSTNTVFLMHKGTMTV